MKRSLRSTPASGNQGTYSSSGNGHSDHLAFNRAANIDTRGYSHGDQDDRSDYPSPPRQLPGHVLPDIPSSVHRYETGGEFDNARNSADLELPLYTKMSSSVHVGGEARRRAGPGQHSAPDVVADQQMPYGDPLAAGNESEKRPLYDSSYADDDTGKAWGSKGFGAGPGQGGRRGLPPMTMRRLTNWKEFVAYHEEWVWTAVYTLLAMFTRYWKIGWANYVVWDEVSTPYPSKVREFMSKNTYAGTFRKIRLPLHQPRLLL